MVRIPDQEPEFMIHVFFVVFFSSSTWSLTLTKEHRLRVSENRALRGIFGPKRHEVTGGWRRLHNEELHTLYVTRK
jgi:hypothetical protein